MNDVTTTSLLFAAVGFVFVALGVPLFRGWVKPNDWYGCRTTKTMSSETVWYAVNRVTGRSMIATGIAVLISSFIVFLLRSELNSDFAAAVLLAVLIIGVALMVVNSLKVQKRL